jgi:hypothetical protein
MRVDVSAPFPLLLQPFKKSRKLNLDCALLIAFVIAVTEA